MLKRHVGRLLSLSFSFIATVSALAAGTASRLPADILGNSETVSVSNGEVIDLNASRDIVVTPNGVESVTSVSVDTTQGLARNFVTRTQDSPLTLLDDEPGSSASVGSIFEIESFIVNSNSDDSDSITFEVSFDASIEVLTGQPLISIGADIGVITGDPFVPTSLQFYQALSLLLATQLEPPGVITQQNGASVSNLITGMKMPWDDFEVITNSLVYDDIRITVRLSVPVFSGQQVSLVVAYINSVGPMLDITDIDISDGRDTFPSSATIDSSNTMQLRVLVTPGVEIVGDDPLLENVVVSPTDSDQDGVNDDVDNCIGISNPEQIDADDDGYGNICDGDYNNDCIVNVVDLGLLRAGFFGNSMVLDINNDGVVNVVDLGLFRTLFFATPGPGQGACEQ